MPDEAAAGPGGSALHGGLTAGYHAFRVIAMREAQGRVRLRVSVAGLALLTALAAVSTSVLAQTTDWPALIQAARPAVVWILAETADGTSLGSGAIVSSDGYILTVAHVIEGATRIKVVVEGSREYGASVVKSDYNADVAVLKIPGSGLHCLPLGDSARLAYEEEIRVLGYPRQGIGVGFIPARGYFIGLRTRPDLTYVQFEASPLDQGHSGGPLIDRHGSIVGIVCSMFAVPELGVIHKLAVATDTIRRFTPWGEFPTGPSLRPPTALAPCPPGMALIPAGSFQMGDSFGEGHPSERPVHEVYVSAFYMDHYEVTKALWDEVADWAMKNGYDIGPASSSGKGPAHPVYDVSWYEAVKWANARSEKEGLTPCYYTDSSQRMVYRTGSLDLSNDAVKWTANGYRLPTEAEWEKAARGGVAGRRFPWGDTIQHARANYYSRSDHSYDTSPTRGYHPTYATGGHPYTSPVGSFAPNGYGLYDMAGNVWEWCWDWVSETYYASSPGSDPRGSASGSYRVDRGGGWLEHPVRNACRVAHHGAGEAFREGIYLGFRLMRTAS